MQLFLRVLALYDLFMEALIKSMHGFIRARKVEMRYFFTSL